VPAGTELVFLSGTLADVAKPDAPAGSIERLGNTETQAASVLGKLAQELAASELTMADVVKMNVFLVGAPSQGKLPTRTTVQVVALPIPGALVEIEAIAARKAAR
jgi:enamine deaminase RidA (YjgF/YER057c/UK114 family)